MTARSSGKILRLILSLLILSGIGGSASAQVSIGGNIKNIRGANKYPHTAVTAIPAANKMTVTNATGFAAGDTVLVIQMQGVQIYSSPYGEWASQYGSPGLWEFIIVAGKSLNDISFANNLKNSYDTRGNIQIVRVPYFRTSARVTSTLVCDPWDPVTKSGGVLPIIVGNTLTLQSNIDVTGSGFKGGAADLGDGICQSVSGSASTYPAAYTNAGYKGEGISNYDDAGVALLPGNEKGKGKNFSGGGGGNGAYSGGGGGSYRGIGGAGGWEPAACIPRGTGATGGKTVQSAGFGNRIFLGGGGGASTRAATGTTGPGGNGGGIVIIIANTIAGSGGGIIAKGYDGGNGGGAGQAGAGGGGSGGAIAISVLNYTGTINADVSGGKGGNNIGRSYGEGGGGGAGLVWLTIDNAANIVPNLNGGVAGTSNDIKAIDGGPGDKIAGFNPTLNGFLFNSLRSSVTQTLADSSCSNMLPPKILGTLPVGGTAPYNVTWEESTDEAFTSPIVLASGVAMWDYTPALKDTVIRSGPVWFRRKIVDTSVPTVLTDISLPVKVTIQPSIKRNYVGPPDTICFAQNPPAVGQMPSTALADGNGIYTYKWMVSTVNGTTGFTTPGSNMGASYTPPPALTLDSWYRRTVYSGRCTDSSGVVKIEVLPSIVSNTITSALAEEICDGSNFSPVTASLTPTLGGGDGIYKYKWISSSNAWGAAPDTFTNPGYNPVAASFALGTQVSLRRVVFSGMHDVCKDTTSFALVVKLTRWPVIINNNIMADQTVGYDSVPNLLTENPAPGMTGGSGLYGYTWQIGPGWGDAPLNPNLKDYQPDSLQTSTTFRRQVNSSACSSISNTVTITVWDPITNNTIALNTPANDTIATGTSPGQLTGTMPTGGSGVPNDFSFKWYVSTTGTFAPSDSIPGARSQNYTPGNLSVASTMANYYFIRKASTPKNVPENEKLETYNSNIIKVTVLPLLSTYSINGSTPKCSGFKPDWLKGSAPVTGGDGKYKYTWQDSTGGGVFNDIPGRIKCDSANYKPPVLTATTSYRRIVYSTANNYTLQNAVSNSVKVIIYPLPTGSITTITDTSICGGTAAKVMVSLTGASKFTVTMKENGTDLAAVNNITGPGYTFTITKTPAAVSEIYTYALSKVVDQNTCQTTTFPAQSRKVTVYKQPAPDAGIEVPHICGPVVTLNASPAVGVGSWSFKKLTTAAVSADPVFNPSGSNTPTVTVTINTTSGNDFDTYRFYWQNDNNGCIAKDSVNVTFDKLIPPVSFTPAAKISNNINRKETLPPYTITVGKGIWESQGASVLDSLPDTNPKVYLATKLVDNDNIYIYQITNGACKESGSYNISYLRIIIPQGISPNGDGANDNLEIKNIDLNANDFTFRIVNSAGSEVFYTDNDNWTVWDGTSNGKALPDGTYYYLLTIRSKIDSNVKDERTGFVVLKMNKY